MFSFFGNKGKQGKTLKDSDYTLLGHGINMESPRSIIPIRIPNEDRKRGLMVFGTTGVGKTRLCENIIEQDIAAGRSVVYIDPKGDQEIFTKVYDAARRHGRLHELQLISPIYPEYSAVINPLAYHYMPDEVVGHITSGIPVGKDPFFRNTAKEFALCSVHAELMLAAHEGRLPNLTFDSIRTSIRRPSMEGIRDSLRATRLEEAERVAGMLDDLLALTPENYSKVTSTLRNTLTDLSAGNIGKIIGQTDSNRFMKRLEEKERVIMIVHTGSMITREAGATLAKTFLSMIQSFIGRVYLSNRQRIEPTLSIIIDEAQLAFFPGVETLFSMGGSAGVMATALCQSINILNTTLDETFTKSILDNTNNKVFMRCTDAETSEYVVKHFGVKSVLSGIYGSNQVTTREVEQDIIRVQDVLSLQRQEFFLLCYTGRYKGTTTMSREVDLKIKFPDTSSAVNNVQSDEAYERAGSAL